MPATDWPEPPTPQEWDQPLIVLPPDCDVCEGWHADGECPGAPLPIEVPADGTMSPELDGDGTGTALPPLEAEEERVLLVPRAMFQDPPAWRSFVENQAAEGFEVADQLATWSGAVQVTLRKAEG